MAYSSLEFEIKGAKEIQKKLDSVNKRFPPVLRTVINNAAKDTKKDLDKAYKKKYALKRGSKTATLKSEVKKANSEDLNAGIKAKGAFVSLSEFQNSKNTKGKGAKAHVYKFTSKKELVKEGIRAFAIEKNGKRIIIRRYPKGEKGKRGGKFFWFPTGFLAYMYFDKETMEQESPRIIDHLEKHARAQMRKVLSN